MVDKELESFNLSTISLVLRRSRNVSDAGNTMVIKRLGISPHVIYSPVRETLIRQSIKKKIKNDKYK